MTDKTSDGLTEGMQVHDVDMNTRDAGRPERGPDRAAVHTSDLAQRRTPEIDPDEGGAGDGSRETGGKDGTGSDGTGTPLLQDTAEYRHRWEVVQTGFVDEPRRAVERADALVAEVMQELASSFAKERDGLESQWSQGDQVSTEDLRISLQRYRSFFDRLLTT